MIKTVLKAYDGLEDVYELLLQKKASLDIRKEEAKQVAIQKIEADFEEEARRIDGSIRQATYEVEVEVEEADVVEEQFENTDTIYGQEYAE